MISLDLESIKYAAPEKTGTTKTIGISSETDVYGYKPSNTNAFWVNHRGYIFAKQPGEYTFSAPSADDQVMVWSVNANSGWTRANALLTQNYVPSGQKAVEVKVNLPEVKYYYLRIVYLNTGGVGNFQFSIKAPDGSVVLDSKSGPSEYIVQFSCDGVAGPKYLPFGAET